MKEIEMKRIRGELSCAECRRLKLRCDKRVPCGSCCRRGCESICPCGILSAGQGTRFILADTEQLHAKIGEMSYRIRQLEDALAILQTSVSTERHLLLSDELLKIKFGAESLPRSRKMQDEYEEEVDKTVQTIDAIGTLTLNESGEGAYFGRSAGSETLMAGEEGSSSEDELEESSREPLPTEIENLANLFPFTHKRKSKSHLLELLEQYLPSHEHAWSLALSYIHHASYFFRAIKQEELLNTLLPNVYNTANQRVRTRININANNVDSPRSDGSDGAEPDNHGCHALATTFFIFALGALFDVNLPPYNSEADKYYDLGRAALSTRSIYDKPSIDTVQAIGLMATYHTLAGKKYSRDSAWALMGLTAKIAQSIGLHRDSARWNLASSMVDKRRNVFWELLTLDISNSLALGRPPSMNLSFIDCEFPIDEEATISNDGQIEDGFWRVKHKFARDVFMPITETTLTAKPTSYASVLNLDRKVREADIPSNLTSIPDGDRSSSASLRVSYATQHRIVPLLYLHRSFFAQALLDHPANPLLSPFSPSFLTAYRTASLSISVMKEFFERTPEIAMRIWFFLYHTFSSAMIVGTVVTRSPSSSFAPRAFQELLTAIELFAIAAKQSSRCRIALNVLVKLKEKASRAAAQYSAGIPQPLHSPIISDDYNDELAIFGGQKRVLARKSKSQKLGTSTSMSDSPVSSDLGLLSPSPNSPTDRIVGSGYQQVHPMLLQFLQGVSFHSPPRRHATIPTPSGNDAQIAQGQPQAAVDNATSDPYSALGSIGDQVGVGTSSPSSTLSTQRYAGSNATTWQGKTEPVSVPLSEPRCMEWLSSPSTSPYRGPDITQRLNAAYPDSPNTLSSSAPLSKTSSNSRDHRLTDPSYSGPVAATNSNSYDMSWMGAGPGYPTNSGFNVPSGAIAELGMSAEGSGMDERWFAFIQDCGLIDGGNNAVVPNT